MEKRDEMGMLGVSKTKTKWKMKWKEGTRKGRKGLPPRTDVVLPMLMF
jgi:hypothetical protein